MSARTLERLAIGIDMGGTTTKYGVVRGHEIIHECEPLPTPEYKGAMALLKALSAHVSALRKQFPGIAAVGMGVPGFADISTGVVHELSNVDGWNEVPVTATLTKETGLPSTVENDANAMAFAEYTHGAGKGSTNMIAVTLGTGVGGGLVLGGQLYRGSAFGAGEIGQMAIDYRGVAGEHGNIGALEKYVGNREVAALAAALYKKAKRKVTAEDCTPRALAAAARRGDAVARDVWDHFTTWLASGLCSCVWLLNPDRIVVGGGVARAGNLVLGPLKKKMQAQLAKPFRQHLDLVPAMFGNEAGILGAAAVALEAAGRNRRK